MLFSVKIVALCLVVLVPVTYYFVTLEYRVQCFKATNGTTDNFQITVNSSDALTKIQQSMIDVTKNCNATSVQCPAAVAWKLMVYGSTSDLYVQNLTPTLQDKYMSECAKPFLYNAFVIDFTGVPWWGILLIVIGCLLVLGTCYLACGGYKERKRKRAFANLGS
jgi:hypothetical protein